jgi:hypothetical protein
VHYEHHYEHDRYGGPRLKRIISETAPNNLGSRGIAPRHRFRMLLANNSFSQKLRSWKKFAEAFRVRCTQHERDKQSRTDTAKIPNGIAHEAQKEEQERARAAKFSNRNDASHIVSANADSFKRGMASRADSREFKSKRTGLQSMRQRMNSRDSIGRSTSLRQWRKNVLVRVHSRLRELLRPAGNAIQKNMKKLLKSLRHCAARNNPFGGKCETEKRKSQKRSRRARKNSGSINATVTDATPSVSGGNATTAAAICSRLSACLRRVSALTGGRSGDEHGEGTGYASIGDEANQPKASFLSRLLDVITVFGEIALLGPATLNLRRSWTTATLVNPTTKSTTSKFHSHVPTVATTMKTNSYVQGSTTDAASRTTSNVSQSPFTARNSGGKGETMRNANEGSRDGESDLGQGNHMHNQEHGERLERGRGRAREQSLPVDNSMHNSVHRSSPLPRSSPTASPQSVSHSSPLSKSLTRAKLHASQSPSSVLARNFVGACSSGLSTGCSNALSRLSRVKTSMNNNLKDVSNNFKDGVMDATMIFHSGSPLSNGHSTRLRDSISNSSPQQSTATKRVSFTRRLPEERNVSERDYDRDHSSGHATQCDDRNNHNHHHEPAPTPAGQVQHTNYTTNQWEQTHTVGDNNFNQWQQTYSNANNIGYSNSNSDVMHDRMHRVNSARLRSFSDFSDGCMQQGYNSNQNIVNGNNVNRSNINTSNINSSNTNGQNQNQNTVNTHEDRDAVSQPHYVSSSVPRLSPQRLFQLFVKEAAW